MMYILKRRFNQWWPTIPQYQQNGQSSLTQLIEQKKDNDILDVGNSGPGFKQQKKCGGIKPVNVDLNAHLLISRY
jgi:hypothetical protein